MINGTYHLPIGLSSSSIKCAHRSLRSLNTRVVGPLHTLTYVRPVFVVVMLFISSEKKKFKQQNK